MKKLITLVSICLLGASAQAEAQSPLDLSIQFKVIEQMLSNDIAENSDVKDKSFQKSVKSQLEAYLAGSAPENDTVTLKCQKSKGDAKEGLLKLDCSLSTYEEWGDGYESAIILSSDVVVDTETKEVKVGLVNILIAG